MIKKPLIIIGFFCFFYIFPNQVIADDKQESSNINQLDPLYLRGFDINALLILQLTLRDETVINPSIISYQDSGKIFLPLGELAENLEFFIELSDEGERAQGWFMDQNRSFSLDLRKNLAVINKREYVITPNDVRLIGIDLFVSSDLLQQWFGLGVGVNPLTQILTIIPSEPIPIELKLIREKKWQKISGDYGGPGEAKEDGIIDKIPYKLADLPLIDMTYQNIYKNDIEPRRSNKLDILASGDLFYLNNQLFANMDDNEGISAARLTSGRKDRDAILLGPLQAREFSVGDVYMPESALIGSGHLGKGVLISNYSDEYVTEFNTATIRGNVQPNWDIELYRNNSLLNFQESSNDGLYNFERVELLPGLNIIQIVSYGPFGQKQTETRRFFVNSELTKEKKFYYRFAANKYNEGLFNPNEDDITKETDKKIGKDIYFGAMEYGLTKTSSMAANLVRIPVNQNGDQKNFSTLSLRSSMVGVYGRLDYVKNMTDGFDAFKSYLQSKIGVYNFNAKYIQYQKDFISEEHQASSNPLLNQSYLAINAPINNSYIPNLNLSLNGTHKYFYSRQARDEITSSIATSIGNKINITQDFDYTHDQSITDETKQIITGSTLFNYRFSGNLSTRSSISYYIKPTTQLGAASITTNYKIGESNNLDFSINHDFGDNPSTSYIVSLSKLFNQYILSLSTNYSDTGTYGVNLTLSFSFGYDLKNQNGIISRKKMASNAAVSTQVFLDENNNGIYDQDEKPIPNIKFRVDNVNLTQISDENGKVMIENVPVNKKAKIEVQTGGLEDPYWIIKNPQTKIITHAGAISELNVAIIATGEIDGIIFIKKDDKIIPVANVELELLDQDNNIVKTTKSAYDGFYLFDQIPLGKYQLRISQKQLTRLKLNNKSLYKIELNSDETVISKMDFVIEKLVEEEEAKTEEKNKSTKPTESEISAQPTKSSEIEEEIVDI